MINIRQLSLIACLATTLVACSNDGGSPPDARTPAGAGASGQIVSGSGVKGPLAGADANLYTVDPTAPDLKGPLLGSGITGPDARLQGLTIPAGQAGLVLLEIVANDATVDLTTGAAPIMNNFRSILTAAEIESGNVYATPLTTLVVGLALAKADSTAAPFTGNGDDSVSIEELSVALPSASRLVVSTLGFGLDVSTNLFTAPPLLTDLTDTEDEQRNVLAYRQAIEAVAAILSLVVEDAKSNNPASTLNSDEVIAAVALDLSDGEIDGQAGGAPIGLLADVSDVANIARTDVSTLRVPGTEVLVANVASIVASEVTQTGAAVSASGISSGDVQVALRAVSIVTDFDGDGVPDMTDAFPEDAEEVADTDGDGIGDNADADADGDGTDNIDDAFPLNPEEVADTDGDGQGNNADTDDDNDGILDADDRFPLDNTETADADGDGIGNNADEDDDNDGTDDANDAFPLIASETADTDGDGIGDNADTDDDNDGVLDGDDVLPLDSRSSTGTRVVIGPDGGSVTSQDQRLQLEFPAGALQADTAITIGQLGADALNELVGDRASAQPYLLGPEGLSLDVPATASFQFTSDEERNDKTRVPFFVTDNLVNTLNESLYQPLSNSATVPLSTLSTFAFGFGRIVLKAEELIDAAVGASFTGQYSFRNSGSGTVMAGEVNPEGFDGTTFSIQPTLGGAEAFVTELAHVTAPSLPLEAGSESVGSISGKCVDVGRNVISFNVDYRDIIDSTVLFNTSPASGQHVVSIDVVCSDAPQPITQSVFIPVGPGIDRVTTIAYDYFPPQQNRTLPPQRLIVVSDNQTLLSSFDGSSQTSISTQPEPDNFGAVLVKNDTTEQIFTYGAGGTTGGVVQDGAFVRLFGSFFNRARTTDMVYALDATGTIDPTRAISVEGDALYDNFVDGNVPERTKLLDLPVVSNDFPGNSVSYSPISATTGVVVTRGESSEAWLIDTANKTGKKLGEVGDDALNVRCVGGLAGGVIGCAVSAYQSKEIRTLFGRGEDFVFGPVISGVSTATLGLRANGSGDMIVSYANDASGALTLKQLTTPGNQTDSGAPLPFGLGIQEEYFISDFFTVSGEVGLVFSLIGRVGDGESFFGSEQLPNGGAVVSGKDGQGEGFVGVVPGELFGDQGFTVWFN